MAENRTTVARVLTILGETDISEIDIESYIGASNTFTTAQLGTSTLGDLVLEEIERWMTAHMISVSRQRMGKKEEAGSAKIEYIGIYGSMLNSTPFGQMVISLDTTGKMAAIGKKTASFNSIKQVGA